MDGRPDPSRPDPALARLGRCLSPRTGGMSLLLAVGKSSSSSCPLWRRRPDADGADAEDSNPPPCAAAVALSPDQRLRALVALRGNPETLTTEVRVRLASAADPLTALEPEVSCRIRHDDDHDDGHDAPSADRIRASAIFSVDNRFLSCLVPACGDSGTGAATVALFELVPELESRGTARDRPPPRTPLPAYVHPPPRTLPGTAPTVTVLRGTVPPDDAPAERRRRRPWISCLEDVAASCRRTAAAPGPSVLLAGTRRGEILAISYNTLAVVGMLHAPSPKEQGADLCHDMRQLRHCTEWSHHDSRGADGGTTISSTGKAVALFVDGSAVVFLSQLRIVARDHEDEGPAAKVDGTAPPGSTDDTGLRIPMSTPSSSHAATDCRMKLEPIYRILGQSFVGSEWLCGSYLALMRHQGLHCTVEAYAIAKDSATPVTAWKITAERLLEERHASFIVDDGPSDGNAASGEHEGTRAMQYDPFSDCLAISGVVATSTKTDGCRDRVAFAGVWNWRSNVEGFLLAPHVPAHGPLLLSMLQVALDGAGATKLMHLCCGNGSATTRLRADVYESAVLSPRSNHPSANGCLGLEGRSNLLLCPSSVSYPTVTKASAMTDYEIEWRESAVPAEYVEAHGPLRLAAIGQQSGRSIAVASSHGFCTLDCSRASLDTKVDGCATYSKAIRHSRTHKRWRRFDKNTEEEAFSVQSMVWWEDGTGNGGEDIVIALIEVRKGEEAGRYLSCWSPKMLDRDHQLMFPASSPRNSRWGIPLPKGFHASSLNILKDPINDLKAIILLSDASAATSFRIYQLQVASEQLVSHDPYRDSLPYVVLAHCACSDSLGSPADLFLASGFFGYELPKLKPAELLESAFIAVLAVRWFPAKGINALCVKPSGIAAVGPILESRPHSVHVEISGVWPADNLYGRHLCQSLSNVNILCWLLEFSDGSLLSWFVPYSTDHDISERLLKPCHENERSLSQQFIHSECSVLGYRTAAGKASFWMHQTSASQRKCLVMNTCPDSAYGCILGSGQAVQKFHRSLGEHFEHELFRSDFLEHETLGPSDLVLSVPAFIPVFYSQLVYAAKVWKERPDELACIFSHVDKRIESGLYRDVASRALQLLVMGLIEEIGSLVERSKSHRVASFVFAALVDYARLCSTPLQFAAVHMEIGRQLEPSYFDYYFPLPRRLLKDSFENGNMPIQNDPVETASTVLDLFDLSLMEGSISTAASSLPLLDDPDTLKSKCELILRYCLERIDTFLESYRDVGFNFVSEEQLVVSDIFRYTMKLENASAENYGEYYDSSDDEYATSNGNGRSLATGALFLFCGMLGRMRLRRPVRPIDDGIRGDGAHWSDEIRQETCARAVAKYLLQSVYRDEQWSKAAALATMVIGGSLSGLEQSTMRRVAQVLDDVGPSQVMSFLPIDYRVNGGLVKYFIQALQSCERQINRSQATSLLDLILVLLERDEGPSSPETLGLLFMAVVTAHVGGRGAEIPPNDHDECFTVLDAFHEALAVLHCI